MDPLQRGKQDDSEEKAPARYPSCARAGRRYKMGAASRRKGRKQALVEDSSLTAKRRQAAALQRGEGRPREQRGEAGPSGRRAALGMTTRRVAAGASRGEKQAVVEDSCLKAKRRQAAALQRGRIPTRMPT